MGGKYIPTQENDQTLLPKMFLRKYGIPEKGIHFLNFNLVILRRKYELRRNIFRTMRVTKCKKGKKGCEFIKFF